MTTKQSRELTLRDRLSRLDYRTASKLLGEKAGRLLALGGAMTIDLDSQVTLTDSHFYLDLNEAKVAIGLSDGARKRLLFECSACQGACEHIGAAFSLVLARKRGGRVRLL